MNRPKTKEWEPEELKHLIRKQDKHGQQVFYDQLKSFQPEFLLNISGRFSYIPATCSSLFVDFAAHKTYAKHKFSTSVVELPEAKSNFEKLAADFGQNQVLQK